MQAVQQEAPHLLRYLAVAIVANKKRRNMLKDLVKIIQSDVYDDPALDFVVAAFVLGGVNYAHLVCEGNPGGCMVPLALNALAVVALQDLTGGGWADVAKAQALLGVAGAVVGVVVSALSPGKPKDE